jgi:hypothetical protein
MTAPAHVGLGPFVPRRRGLRAGTGVPVVDARADFQRARRAEILARALHRLPPPRRRPVALPALDGVHALSWTGRDLRVIALRAIVGTVDATTDFDADFRPATNRVAARWQRVALAHRRGQALPAITVIERPDGYYVIDGRHRVSVARALGQTDIEAWVGPTFGRPYRPTPPATKPAHRNHNPLYVRSHHHAPDST